MNKFFRIFILLAVLVFLSACNSTKEFVADYQSAIGVIFVNDKQELPASEKVYAHFENNAYSFDLDAACIYYFKASEEVSYAGEQNLTQLTFSSNIDNGAAGAKGSAAYDIDANSENNVDSYYLYHDENGVYFNTGISFNTVTITDECVLNGTDYACAVKFEVRKPTTLFTVSYYDDARNIIYEKNYSPEDVTDNQTFEMDSNVNSVEITCFGADNAEIETNIITAVTPRAVICYQSGGQILSSKILRFIWQ
jgi:hypothetical protein